MLPVADTHLYKQLGNTVTVNVIEAIASRILDYLNELFSSRRITEIRKEKVLSLLEEGPLSCSQIAIELEWLFMSDMDELAIKKATRAILQSLKREGRIISIGRTRSSVWALK